MSRFGKFKINEVEYDLDDLTLDEIEVIEEQAGGIPFSEVNYGSAKGMKAFAYVLMKRNNADLTMEDVGKVKIVAFETADEEMPSIPPVPEAVAERGGQNVSAEADSGVQGSLESTTG